MRILMRIMIISCLAIGLIYLKTRVVKYEKKIITLNHKIANVHEDINILNAEYAYLTRPDRIRDLAANKLQMQTPAAAQIATINVDGAIS